MNNFHKRRWELDEARNKKMKDLISEYDETVYYPAKRALIAECGQIGHHSGKYHDNGLGWSWYYCAGCGGRYDITGPNGEKNDKDCN